VLLLALSGCTTYFVLRRSQPLVLQPAAEPPAPSEVEWRVPVGCDFSGFFVEVVLGFVPALARRRLLSPLRPGGHSRLHLLTGRCSSAFLAKLAPVEAAAYTSTWSDEAERSKGGRTAASIVIEHGHPCERRAWRADERPLWVVQRAMSEANLSTEAALCLRDADEVWVPSEWHRERFEAAGVRPSVLRVVGQPVDVTFFDPRKLPPRAPAKDTPACSLLSVFKWEARKGWDALLTGYFAEFRRSEGTLLRIKTYVPPWEAIEGTLDDVLEHAAQRHLASVAAPGPTPRRARDALPRVEVVTELDVSRDAMRRLYSAADAFVLPTRGEGWGLPVVEAMAMELPVVVTNASGPTAYLTARNSYPVAALPGVDGAAEPSQSALQRGMRRACFSRAEARARGKAAREDMVTRFSPDAMGDVIVERLREAWARPEVQARLARSRRLGTDQDT